MTMNFHFWQNFEEKVKCISLNLIPTHPRLLFLYLCFLLSVISAVLLNGSVDKRVFIYICGSSTEVFLGNSLMWHNQESYLAKVPASQSITITVIHLAVIWISQSTTGETNSKLAFYWESQRTQKRWVSISFYMCAYPFAHLQKNSYPPTFT